MRIGLSTQVFWGLIAQWAVVFLVTLVWSASVDFARVGSVWTTLALNGILTGVPLWFVLRSPGERSSRLAVAVSQGLFSTLLFYATAGRVETHLHLFAWLMVLAAYRDVRVLIAAGVVAVVSQLVFGLVAVPAAMNASSFGHLGEHVVWLVVETTCLASFVRVRVRAMSDLARREAALESLNNNLERKVERRTREMSEKLDALQREYAVIQEIRDQTQADEMSTTRQLSQLRREVSVYATTLMDTTWSWSEARLPELLRPHWKTIREASQHLLSLVDTSTPADDSLSNSLIGLQTFNLETSAADAKNKKVDSSVDPTSRSALLLIDDPVQQALAVRSLSEEGFRADVVHSGPRAYYSAMLRDYDLILVDVNLANEEGFDTLEALRLLPNGIGDFTGLFAITDSRTAEVVLRGTSLGVDGFVVKPMNSESLRAALAGHAHIDSSRDDHVQTETVAIGS